MIDELVKTRAKFCEEVEEYDKKRKEYSIFINKFENDLREKIEEKSPRSGINIMVPDDSDETVIKISVDEISQEGIEYLMSLGKIEIEVAERKSRMLIIVYCE